MANEEVNQTTTPGGAPESPAPSGYLDNLPPEIKATLESREYQRGDQDALDRVTRYHQAEAGKEDRSGYESVKFSSSIPANVQGEFISVARAAKIDPAEAQRFANDYAKVNADVPQADRDRAWTYEDADQRLREWFGTEYEAKVADARYFVEQLGPEFAAYIERAGMANDPYAIRYLAERGAALAAEGEEITNLMMSPHYLDERSPRHKAVFERVTRAFQKRFGTAPTGQD